MAIKSLREKPDFQQNIPMSLSCVLFPLYFFVGQIRTPVILHFRANE